MAEKYQIVRYKIKKKKFEILTKPGTVLNYRNNKCKLNDVLESDAIFLDHRALTQASNQDLISAFGTDDKNACIITILDKGELNLSSNERKEKTDKKKAEIINYIHKYFVDPKTNQSHPIVRIENALVDAKVNVDMNQPVEEQMTEILKKLPGILSVKKVEIEAILKIPHKYLGQSQGIIRKWATVNREKYTPSHYVFEIGVIPGNYDILMKDVQKITEGNADISVSNQQNQQVTQDEQPKGRKGKRKGKGKGNQTNQNPNQKNPNQKNQNQKNQNQKNQNQKNQRNNQKNQTQTNQKKGGKKK